MSSFPSKTAVIVLILVACLPEFEPNLADTPPMAIELPPCGAEGGSCCPAPAAACERDDLVCGSDNRCTRRPVLSCRGDEECRAGDVCCTAGFLGTCESVAREACPALDLTASPPVVDALSPIESRVFDPLLDGDRCLIESGCVGGPGLRRLLRVSATVDNVGEADLLLGSPEDTAAPTILTCSGELRFAAWLRYELVDGSGIVARQDVPASCSTPAPGRIVSPFDCDFQGIWSGFSQSHDAVASADGAAQGCRWLDITDVVQGQYTLRVTVNPDGVLPERNLGNNTPAELPIAVPAFDPTRPCPVPSNPLLGSGSRRECGWRRAAFQTEALNTSCSPGGVVAMRCTSRDSSYPCGDYRFCDGPEVCSYAESLAPEQEPCSSFSSPDMVLTCPASGRYSLWLAGDDPGGFSCEVLSLERIDPSIAPDAGAPQEP